MTFLKKILLVDYEPKVTACVRRALEKTGRYLIKEEHDTRLAMNAARWFQPDLIVCDTQAAGVDAALLRDLRCDSACKEMPVVFVSPDPSGKDAVVSGGILGGYSFLTGPVPLEQISRYVSELLNAPSDVA
jgi:DNA-binding response OmpR family regulator